MRIEDVPWETVGAADLPAWLRAIAAPVLADGLAALDEVRARIWRDGEVLPAAPHAVPFLAELALAPEVLVRPPILQLLAFLHAGQPEIARAAVRRRLADYLALLSDDDRDVRIAAACLAVGFRDRDAEPDVRRALERRFAVEPDEVVRANLLGCLNVYLPTSHLEIYDDALTSDTSLLVRREAAHSVLAIDRADAPTLAVAVLLEATLRAAEVDPLYAGVAWNRRGVVADSMWALLQLGPTAAAPYLRHLEKLMGRAVPADALAIAEAALLIAFGGPASARSYAELDPGQVSFLRALAAADAVWGQELPRMLAHYGLPREQKALRAFAAPS